MYSGELSESITTAEISQVTRPQNRGILLKDILISTAASTFGAMAQVTAKPVGVTTVTVEFIGTLKSEGGGGGTTLNKYTTLIAQSASATDRTLLHRIIQNAKGNIQIQDAGFPFNFAYCSNKVELHGVKVSSSFLGRGYSINQDGTISYNGHALCKTGETLTITTGTNAPQLTIVYYNDVEIT